MEKERDKAIVTSQVANMYIDQALALLDKLNPIPKMNELVVSAGKGEPLDLLQKVGVQWNALTPHVTTFINIWDDALKVARDTRLVSDLISRAAELTKGERKATQ
jgi:hypothetical protein